MPDRETSSSSLTFRLKLDGVAPAGESFGVFYRGADDPVLGGYALFCGGDPRARACEGGGTVYELQLVVGRGTALRFAFKRGLSEEIHERSGETVAEGAVRLDADATVEASYDFGTARPVR